LCGDVLCCSVLRRYMESSCLMDRACFFGHMT
jgi:hypothetical protein